MAILSALFLFAAIFMTAKLAYVIVQYEHLVEGISINIGCSMVGIPWVAWVWSMGWLAG